MVEERTSPPSFISAWNTSAGVFEVTVHRAWSPEGADRLWALILSGYYDDSRFYRVVRGWVAQFGVAGDSAVAASMRHAHIPDDPVVKGVHNDAGFLTYSAAYNSDNSRATNRTTELFINLDDHRELDALGFAPVGYVSRGFSTVVLGGVYDGYGEMRDACELHGFEPCDGPTDPDVYGGGNAYLDSHFPLLTRLRSVAILSASNETVLSAGGGEDSARFGNPASVAIPVLCASLVLVLVAVFQLRRPWTAAAAAEKQRIERTPLASASQQEADDRGHVEIADLGG